MVATGAAAYMFWVRDSSLVAVDNVDVVGVTSGDRAQIVGELTKVAEDMTTLHVDAARLDEAARAFPTVAAISIDPNFPHGMRIEVTERPPAMVVSAAASRSRRQPTAPCCAGWSRPEPGIVIGREKHCQRLCDEGFPGHQTSGRRFRPADRSDGWATAGGYDGSDRVTYERLLI